MRAIFLFIWGLVVSATAEESNAVELLSEGLFTVRTGDGGITSLKRMGDSYETDYIMDGKALGELAIRYRVGTGDWREFLTWKSAEQRRVNVDSAGKALDISYNIGDKEIELTERFRVERDSLVWTLELRNGTDGRLEVGDVGLPLLFNTAYVKDPITTYTKRVMKHSFISGNGSFIYWCRRVRGASDRITCGMLNDTSSIFRQCRWA